MGQPSEISWEEGSSLCFPKINPKKERCVRLEREGKEGGEFSTNLDRQGDFVQVDE